MRNKAKKNQLSSGRIHLYSNNVELDNIELKVQELLEALSSSTCLKHATLHTQKGFILSIKYLGL